MLLPVFVGEAEGTITDRFPAVRGGCWFFYNVSQPVLNATTKQTTFVRTWAWNYTVVKVDNATSVVELNVTWFEYRDGTLVGTGGYYTYVHAENLTRFEIFFDVTKLNESLLGMLKMWNLTNSNFTYSLVPIDYVFGNITLAAINGSYHTVTLSGEEFWGYFIVSTKYGLVLEKAQFAKLIYQNSSKAAPPSQNYAMKLVATNFALLLGFVSKNIISALLQNWWLIVLIVLLIAVPAVLCVWLRRKRF